MHTGAQLPDLDQRPDHHRRGADRRRRREFALEGSVFIGGAVVQWLRDGLRAIPASGEVQALAESVPDTGGVMFVPAFTGLGAPYWKRRRARRHRRPDARQHGGAHRARGAREHRLPERGAAAGDEPRRAAAGGAPVTELRVDGGACVNDLLMQFQADLLGIPVVRPKVIETTALGAAYLAGLAVGVYRDTDELAAQWQVERTSSRRCRASGRGADGRRSTRCARPWRPETGPRGAATVPQGCTAVALSCRRDACRGGLKSMRIRYPRASVARVVDGCTHGCPCYRPPTTSGATECLPNRPGARDDSTALLPRQRQLHAACAAARDRRALRAEAGASACKARTSSPST